MTRSTPAKVSGSTRILDLSEWLFWPCSESRQVKCSRACSDGRDTGWGAQGTTGTGSWRTRCARSAMRPTTASATAASTSTSRPSSSSCSSWWRSSSSSTSWSLSSWNTLKNLTSRWGNYFEHPIFIRRIYSSSYLHVLFKTQSGEAWGSLSCTMF